MGLPDSDGWIGRWSPGIGDPTVVGWMTIIFYLLGAWQCYRIATASTSLVSKQERLLWWAFAIALLVLGINKQLDLQSALTEIGRIVATEQGWYDRRLLVQKLFIYGVTTLAGLAAISGAYLARNAPHATISAFIGSVLLLAFVVIRAASFHHFDILIDSEFLGLRMNWIMEIGGICIIAFSALWRLRTRLR